MLRSLFLVLAILYSNSGCSPLHPMRQPHVQAIQDKANHTDIADTMESTDDRSTDVKKDGDTSKWSIADAAFAVVFVPVYFTGCFFWWVAHGCPSP